MRKVKGEAGKMDEWWIGRGGIAVMFGSFVAGKSLLPCLWFRVSALFLVGKSEQECNEAFNFVITSVFSYGILLPYDLSPLRLLMLYDTSCFLGPAA